METQVKTTQLLKLQEDKRKNVFEIMQANLDECNYFGPCDEKPDEAEIIQNTKPVNTHTRAYNAQMNLRPEPRSNAGRPTKSTVRQGWLRTKAFNARNTTTSTVSCVNKRLKAHTNYTILDTPQIKIAKNWVAQSADTI